MRSNLFAVLLFTMTIFAFSGASSDFIEDTKLEGYWVRTADHLQIQVIVQHDSVLYSFVTQEGDKRFPCAVKELPIYKNIRKAGKNLWNCDFLVVTMGSCSTAYEEGSIRMNKNGQMEINCPGFAKKIYSKIEPRYERGG